MRKIPLDLREEMERDPFYARCCLTGMHRGTVRIEWHHNLIFAGKQVNEKWCILPLAKQVHERANEIGVKEQLDWIMLNRATDVDLEYYSKAVNLTKRRDMLNRMYGTWRAFA